jgi:mannose-6-phosphate isomerase-like protein (cupin superfamily)
VWEPTIVLTTLLFPVLSVGVSSAVALVLGADGCRVGLLAVGALMLFVPLSFWIWAVAGQRPGMPATRQRDSMPVLGDNLETHRWGNAADLAKQHMGWFLGHFMSASDGLLRTKAVEVKWGAHPRGEERGTWAKGKNVNSISILLRGDFTITFDNRSYDLKSEGDFVIWGPGVTHTWRANEESVILTVRWPSLEPEGGG